MQIIKFLSVGIWSLVALLLWGCNRYTTATPTTNVSTYPKVLERAKKDHRNIVMQSGVNYYTMTSFDMDKAKRQMTITLDKVDSLHRSTKTTGMTSQPMNSSFKPSVYVIMKDSISYTLDEPHTIPIERITRIETRD